MADDESLDDLEEELAGLEEELRSPEEEPASPEEEPASPEEEPASPPDPDPQGDPSPEGDEDPSPEPDPPDADGEEEEGGLVDRVRSTLPVGGDGDEDDEADPAEPRHEPPEAGEPSEAEAPSEVDEGPWTQEGGRWVAEGEGEAEAGETVLVRRLDEEGNVVEERRARPGEVAAAGGNPDPGPGPDPEPGDDEDDGSRSWIVLLIVGILILAVVGAGVAYLYLGDVGETEAPTASFTRSPSDAVATGDTVTFDASGSSVPDGADATYEWEFGDGGTAQGEQVSHAFQASGTFTVTLTVTAGDQEDTATDDVTVVTPPTARLSFLVNGSEVATDNPALVGQEVTLSGADSEAEGAIASYTWTVDGETATGAEITRTFEDPGPHAVELAVEDGAGFSDTTSAVLGVSYNDTFEDTLPAAVTEPSQGPPHNFTVGHGGLVPDLVRLELAYEDPTGPLGDPIPARLNLTDHAGTVVAEETGSGGNATLEVTDAGQYAPGTWTVHVEQDEGGAEKSYTLDLLVVYPTG